MGDDDATVSALFQGLLIRDAELGDFEPWRRRRPHVVLYGVLDYHLMPSEPAAPVISVSPEKRGLGPTQQHRFMTP